MSAKVIPFPIKTQPAGPLDCPVAMFAVGRLLEFLCYDHDHGNVRPLREYQAILDDSIKMGDCIERQSVFVEA
jgi:hypothetical protein